MGDTVDEKNFWLLDLGECINGKRSGKHEEFTREYEKGIDDSGSAPVWVPDKNATRCMICGEYFTVVRRRHHCRNCGKVICGNCSTAKRIISNIDGAKPERVCDFCDDFMKIQEMEAKGLSSASEGQQQPLSLTPRSQKISRKTSITTWQPEEKRHTSIFHKDKSAADTTTTTNTTTTASSSSASSSSSQNSNESIAPLAAAAAAAAASGHAQRKVHQSLPPQKPPHPTGTPVAVSTSSSFSLSSSARLSNSSGSGNSNSSANNIVITRKKTVPPGTPPKSKISFSARTMPAISSASVMNASRTASCNNNASTISSSSPQSGTSQLGVGVNELKKQLNEKDKEIERLRKELSIAQDALKKEREKTASLQAELNEARRQPQPQSQCRPISRSPTVVKPTTSALTGLRPLPQIKSTQKTIIGQRPLPQPQPKV